MSGVTLEQQTFLGHRVDPSTVELFYSPKDRLRMTVEGRVSYPTVKPAWASPLYHPGKYLSLLNAKGEEILMISNPAELSAASREAVLEEVRRRYLTATVLRVLEARIELGVTYWHVVTDRGERDFVTQSLQENAQFLDDDHLLLTDVDGNRFEIKHLDTMDAKTQMLVRSIL